MMGLEYETAYQKDFLGGVFGVLRIDTVPGRVRVVLWARDVEHDRFEAERIVKEYQFEKGEHDRFEAERIVKEKLAHEMRFFVFQRTVALIRGLRSQNASLVLR